MCVLYTSGRGARFIFYSFKFYTFQICVTIIPKKWWVQSRGCKPPAPLSSKPCCVAVNSYWFSSLTCPLSQYRLCAVTSLNLLFHLLFSTQAIIKILFSVFYEKVNCKEIKCLGPLTPATLSQPPTPNHSF